MTRLLRASLMALLLAGCAQSERVGEPLPTTTLPAKPPEARSDADRQPLIRSGPATARQSITSGPSVPTTPATQSTASDRRPVLTGRPGSVVAEQMPLPAFINTVLGEALHLNFTVDPRVASRNELVTLRFTEGRSADELLAVTAEVLRDYAVELVFERDLVRVQPNDPANADMPRIIVGRAVPDVSANLRPIFQVVTLHQVSAGDIGSWLLPAFGNKLKVTASPQGNNVLLLGLPDDVRAAVEAIRSLDQPRLGGRKSLKIEPIYWSATGMAERLVDILKSEGYFASSSVQSVAAAITVLPIANNNSVLVFAADQTVVDHVGTWARELDQPARVDPGKSLFFYPVRNTTADSLGKVLESVTGEKTGSTSTSKTGTDSNLVTQAQRAGSAAGITPPPAPNQQQQGGGGSEVSAVSTLGGLRVVIDPIRNALIFVGSAESYTQIRPLVESLDVAPREAIIEVTVAEVTLNNDTELGVEFAVDPRLGNGGNRVTGGTVGGLGLGSGGFNLQVLSPSGSVRAQLHALESRNRVSVLSTPRLLSRSGATASIQIGSDVPIVTSQTNNSGITLGGTSALAQSVEYRSTGVILEVKPTIYAGSQIDLEIKQEVSDPQNNTASGITSPIINKRTVATQLSLADAETVVLGGLISDTKNDTDSGVPGLQDIPVLGALFKSQALTRNKRELLIFITPYIINSRADSERISETFRGRMQTWETPRTEFKW